MTYGLDGVTVRFGEVVALDDVSLELEPGTVTAIVGGDGAGKSTLLHCLAGTVAATTGTVRRPPKQRLGSMSSNSGAWGDLTVDENISFVGGCYGMGRDAIAARRDELLERAGLASAADRLVRDLSGGMRQKLGFVLAFLHRPEVLLLDEPSTGVDPVSRVELWRMIAEAAAAGVVVAMTTTYLDEAERCPSILVLADGAALARGSLDDVVGAVPGEVREVAEPTEPTNAWRHGRVVLEWFPDGSPIGTPVDADLEAAVISLMLDRGRRSSSEPVGP